MLPVTRRRLDVLLFTSVPNTSTHPEVQSFPFRLYVSERRYTLVTERRDIIELDKISVVCSRANISHPFSLSSRRRECSFISLSNRERNLSEEDLAQWATRVPFNLTILPVHPPRPFRSKIASSKRASNPFAASFGSLAFLPLLGH